MHLSEGALSHELAVSMQSRLRHGKVAIVVREPNAMLASTRKQWLRLMRQVMKRRASTLDAVKIFNLTEDVSFMQRAQFTARGILDSPEADAWFGTVEDFVECPPMCMTLFITYPISDAERSHISAYMPGAALIVEYKVGEP